MRSRSLPRREVPVTHILLVDDDPDLCRLLAARMSERGFTVAWRTSGEAALAALEELDVDAVVTDVRMDGMSGLDLCERIVTNRPDLPVLLLTAYGTLEAATAAIRVGAWDFLEKPPDPDALALAVERAAQSRQLRREVRRLRAEPPSWVASRGMIAGSPAMEAVCKIIDRVAETDVSVLIAGESGSGKEVVARALHAGSRRAAGPFVAVNCAAIPEALLESEFFGHVRGAFTDARTDRPGLVTKAHGGTLFLDEIGELPPSLQPKLLRVIQERVVRPVGGDVEVPCDVRLLTASNRDLDVAVRRGEFREDLYFRINVVRIDVPPLRTRGNDVLALAQHFLGRCAAATGKRVVGLSPAAAQCLLRYAWPGNVRELQNCIERAVVFARYEELVVDDLPDAVRTAAGRSAAAAPLSPLLPLAEAERQHILRVVQAVHGNRTVAAQILGVDRKTLARKLKSYASAEETPEAPLRRTAQAEC
jgi:two-component system, NtrC family, response regulator AtoC